MGEPRLLTACGLTFFLYGVGGCPCPCSAAPSRPARGFFCAAFLSRQPVCCKKNSIKGLRAAEKSVNLQRGMKCLWRNEGSVKQFSAPSLCFARILTSEKNTLS